MMILSIGSTLRPTYKGNPLKYRAGRNGNIFNGPYKVSIVYHMSMSMPHISRWLCYFFGLITRMVSVLVEVCQSGAHF